MYSVHVIVLDSVQGTNTLLSGTSNFLSQKSSSYFTLRDFQKYSFFPLGFLYQYIKPSFFFKSIGNIFRPKIENKKSTVFLTCLLKVLTRLYSLQTKKGKILNWSRTNQ